MTVLGLDDAAVGSTTTAFPANRPSTHRSLPQSRCSVMGSRVTALLSLTVPTTSGTSSPAASIPANKLISFRSASLLVLGTTWPWPSQSCFSLSLSITYLNRLLPTIRSSPWQSTTSVGTITLQPQISISRSHMPAGNVLDPPHPINTVSVGSRVGLLKTSCCSNCGITLELKVQAIEPLSSKALTVTFPPSVTLS